MSRAAQGSSVAAATAVAPRRLGAGTAEPTRARADVHEDRTRDRVVQAILADGPATVSVLASLLHLTPAAVRRHLDALLDAGAVRARDTPQMSRRGRGRPAKEFVLTDVGRDGLHHRYDDLATSALRFLAARAGGSAVEDFARSRVVDVEQRCGDSLAAARPQDRPTLLAEVLSAEGYAASVRHTSGGVQLCQHHCPVAHVAAEFPELCEAETEAFSRLLGTHVQRLATIAHGDGVCTTYVPGAPGTTDRATEDRTTHDRTTDDRTADDRTADDRTTPYRTVPTDRRDPS